MVTTVQTGRPGIQALERAAAIMRLLAGRHTGWGVAELARALGLPKGTVHGILRTLQSDGLIEQNADSGRYRVGAALLPLGVAYLEANRFRGAVLGPAHALGAQAGETVQVAIPCDHQVLVIHHLPSPGSRRPAPEVGRLAPVHATALGKALMMRDRSLLAHVSGSRLHRYTAATITQPTRLRREVAASARRGWAGDVGELYEGVASIAAPVAGLHPPATGAIGLEGPIDRLYPRGRPRGDLRAAVLAAARDAARAVGAAV